MSESEVIKKTQDTCTHELCFMTLSGRKGIGFCPKCLKCSDDKISYEDRIRWKEQIEQTRKDFDRLKAHQIHMQYIKKVARSIFALEVSERPRRMLVSIELKVLKEIGFTDWADLLAHPPETAQKKIDASIYKEYFKNAER